MIARVYAPEASGTGDTLDVPAEEARWLRDVLRLGAGDRVRVFDGRGREWRAAIAECAKARVTVTLQSAIVPHAETRVAYTLAMSVLKGDNADDVVRDAVMMGVVAIRPFVCSRTEIGLGVIMRGHRRERWERVAVASAKQSGRAVVPVVHEVVAFEALLRERDLGLRLLLVEPAIAVEADPIAALTAPSAACVTVGPEGGWTADDVAAAMAAGWRVVRLGGRVLRADAAPLAALAACQAVWQDS